MILKIGKTAKAQNKLLCALCDVTPLKPQRVLRFCDIKAAKSFAFLRLGFTLMEMIVILAIIGIILGMSVPFFSQFISSARLKTTIRDVITTLSTARSYAITKRVDCSVIFDLEKEEYWIEALDSVLEKKNKAPEGIDLLDTTFPSQRVTFLPTGALIGPSGSITIVNKGGRIKLVRVINVTGKIKVE